MPEPHDQYLQALRAAADRYATDEVGSQSAAIVAAIAYLHAFDADPSLTTPFQSLLGHLADQSERWSRIDEADEDGRVRGMGRTKPVMMNLNDAAVSAVVTLAMRAGKTRQQAAVMVAHQIGWGAHDPRGVQRLLQSRKNLMDKKASPQALRIYNLIIATARKSGTTPEDALQLGLDFLTEKIMGRSSQSS